MIGFGGGVGHGCLRARPMAGGAVAVAGCGRGLLVAGCRFLRETG